MKTNFFTTIKELVLSKGIDATITLKLEGDNIVVAFKPQYQRNEKAPVNNLRPLMLTHPAESLDDNFFETITEPVNLFFDTAKEIEEWKKSLSSTKEKETKADEKKETPDAKPSGKKKKKKATPAARPADTKTQAERAAEKQKEIDLKKATGIAVHGKKRFETGDYKAALSHYKKAYDIMPLEGWKTEIEKMEALIKEQEERSQREKEAHEAEQKAKQEAQLSKLIMQAEAARKGQDFQYCAKNWIEAYKIDPANPKLQEIKNELEQMLGTPTVKTLLQL